MTPELQAKLVEIAQRIAIKMREEEYSDLKDLRDKQRGGWATQEEFVKSRNIKVQHIEHIQQEQREMLEQVLIDAKRRQSPGGSNTQQMDAVLAALSDISKRLAKLENGS